MSDIKVIRSISRQTSGIKSKSDHKDSNISSKQKEASDQQITDHDQNENISNTSNLKLKSNEKILSKTNQSGQIQTVRKCLRKGSRICYTDMENITVLRKIPEKDASKMSFLSNQNKNQSFEKVDSYRSGESLFKTFTFEQTRDIDDPETVKCIEFWKSVMKKNLAPIKCTLLESNIEPTKRKSSTPKDRSSKSSRKSEEKTENLNFTGDGARIWSEALKEIRRKKLDQLKLYVRERCQYCSDPFTKELEEKLGYETSEDQNSEIVSLNDWKAPNEQIDLIENNLSKIGLKKRISVKVKKMSVSDPKTGEKSNFDQAGREGSAVLKTKSPEEGAVNEDKRLSQEPPKKLPSILKSSSKVSQARASLNDSTKKPSGQQMSSVEIQAPTVKCPCESDTCVCPHRAAARNSRTSFVEIARKNMLQRDGSTEKFFPKDEEPCVCEVTEQKPWNKIVCENEPCPAKSPKVKPLESSSDFNMPVQNTDDLCVCAKKSKVVCPSDNCQNKISQGSLVEGFPEVKDDKKDACVCNDPDSEAPCISDVCPTKTPKEVPKTCVCSSNLPWAQATCRSWSCSHNRRAKIKIRRDDDEEKIRFTSHPPIKEVTSTCTCQQKIPWRDVTCECETCAVKPKQEPVVKVKDKKSSVLKISLKSKGSSKESLGAKKTRSKEKFTIVPTSAERLSKEKEKTKPKTAPLVSPSHQCVCSAAPPWKVVTCKEKCMTKDEEKRELNAPSSVERVSYSTDDECVCKDKSLEPTCKIPKCENKLVCIEYTQPCICPKDVENTKQHFTCTSEICKMKNIDKTCLCRLQPDAPCDAKTCSSKPQASKTLVHSKKPVKYDPKCICKVRGLPTTEDVTCAAPGCPFKRKYPKLVKKKIPKLYVPPPYEYKGEEDETKKCICSTKEASIFVKCHSMSCKRKNRSGKSEHSGDEFYDEDNSEQEVCICKDEQTDYSSREEEVICEQIQCPKTHVGEDGAVMNDKCVCANLDETCDEPTCPSGEEYRDKICSEIALKTERPYCLICGHYECGKNRRLSRLQKICKEMFTDMNDDM